jgi:hypothetical protein
MGQTVGSQIVGSWYDIIGYVFASAMSFYWAIAAQNMPPHQKERLPAILKNRKFCIGFGLLLALMSIGKVLKWW